MERPVRLIHTPYLHVSAAFPACAQKPPWAAILVVSDKKRDTQIPKPGIPPFFETCKGCIKLSSSVDQIPLMKPRYNILETRAGAGSYWQEAEKLSFTFFSQ